MSGIPQYLEACHYRKGFLSDQLAWLQEERQGFSEDAERLEGSLERIRQEMVGYLIPDVDDAHLEALETRLSYPGLRPIKRQYEAKFDAAEARRVELEAMDEIQFHDFQLDQATKEVEEVRPTYEEYQRKLSCWEDSRCFRRLKKRGFFELGYRSTFFSWFFDWRNVSLLMSEVRRKAGGDFPDPHQLRLHYRGLREEADTVIAAYDKRAARRDRIVALKEEHDATLRAPERLLSELYRDLGKATLEHLQACPEQVRLELAQGDRHLNTFLRKDTGIQKQIQYLREVSVTRIDSNVQQVQQELVKIKAKVQKLNAQRRRGKRKFYSQSDIQRMRNVKADKWEKRRRKTRDIRGKIVNFDRYDRGSFVRDYLWWDLVTGGARGDDLFEVREFRQRHPDWNYRDYQDPTERETLDGNAAIDDAAEELAASMSVPDDDLFLDAT